MFVNVSFTQEVPVDWFVFPGHRCAGRRSFNSLRMPLNPAVTLGPADVIPAECAFSFLPPAQSHLAKTP